MICTCMNELASLCDLLNIREHCEDVRVYIMRILKVIAGTMQLICYAAFFLRYLGFNPDLSKIHKGARVCLNDIYNGMMVNFSKLLNLL